MVILQSNPTMHASFFQGLKIKIKKLVDGDPNAAGRILALLPGACKIGLKKEKEKEKGKKSKEKSVYSAFEKESSARKNPMYRTEL